MIGRRATVGLSLLCALAFSAVAVEGAGATVSNNTTAVTCAKEGLLEFSDAHCDKNVGPGSTFGHVSLPVPLGQPTEIETSNETTGGVTIPEKFFGEPFKVQTEIECTKATGTGTVTNTEEPAGSHNHKVDTTGTKNLTSCTVKKPAKCTVKEPIEMKVESVGVDGLEGKGEMGVESKPKGGGTTLTTITLEGSECALKGKPFNVEGTMIGTSGSGSNTNKWSGATTVFTKLMTEKTLKAAEKFAWWEGTTTIRMKGGGNPIVLTTTT